MKITVYTTFAREIILDYIDPTMTIKDLKKIIHREENIPTKDQYLQSIGGQELPDTFTVAHGAAQGSLSNSFYLDNKPYQVLARDMATKNNQGRIQTFEVRGVNKVEHFKKMIEGRLGVPTRLMRLLYGGKYLKDGCTLADYKIVQESTVTLLLPLFSCKDCSTHESCQNHQ